MESRYSYSCLSHVMTRYQARCVIRRLKIECILMEINNPIFNILQGLNYPSSECQVEVTINMHEQKSPGAILLQESLASHAYDIYSPVYITINYLNPR